MDLEAWAECLEAVHGHIASSRVVEVEAEPSTSAIQKAYSPNFSNRVAQAWATTMTSSHNLPAVEAEAGAAVVRGDSRKQTDTAGIEP